HSGRLYLTFSDNRNGLHDSDHPVTNSDVFVVQSDNGGTDWTSPTLVDAGAGDQWFPWADVNPATGQLGILYHDRGASNGPTCATRRPSRRGCSRSSSTTRASNGVRPGPRRRGPGPPTKA